MVHKTLACRPMPKHPKPSPISSVNLESGMPTVHDALSRLDRELATAAQHGLRILKLIHGYGSTGVGGDLRIAIQKRLRDLQDQGAIRACIFGENWSPSDSETWTLLKRHPALKSDPDIGRNNRGITIVFL